MQKKSLKNSFSIYMNLFGFLYILSIVSCQTKNECDCKSNIYWKVCENYDFSNVNIDTLWKGEENMLVGIGSRPMSILERKIIETIIIANDKYYILNDSYGFDIIGDSLYFYSSKYEPVSVKGYSWVKIDRREDGYLSYDFSREGKELKFEKPGIYKQIYDSIERINDKKINCIYDITEEGLYYINYPALSIENRINLNHIN